MNYWVTMYRFAWGVLIVLCAIGLACVFVPKCRSLQDLHQEKVVLEEENSGAEGRIKDLRVKRERFASDPLFVERTARESGMVKPHETVFKFSSAGSSPPRQP